MSIAAGTRNDCGYAASVSACPEDDSGVACSGHGEFSGGSYFVHSHAVSACLTIACLRLLVCDCLFAIACFAILEITAPCPLHPAFVTTPFVAPVRCPLCDVPFVMSIRCVLRLALLVMHLHQRLWRRRLRVNSVPVWQGVA